MSHKVFFFVFSFSSFSVNSFNVFVAYGRKPTRHAKQRGKEQGSKSLFSLLSEPTSPSSINAYLTFSPSSLLLPPISPSSQLFGAISPSSLFCSSPLSTANATLRDARNQQNQKAGIVTSLNDTTLKGDVRKIRHLGTG